MDPKERIKFILKETNPWWKDKEFKLKNYSSRKIYSSIEKFLSLPQIVALTGLRRTGKTTLMSKIIEDKLKSIKPEHILYFSFDDFSLLDIEDIVSAYMELFPEVNMKEHKFLFCFDEIQKLQNWQEKLKRLYDTYRNVKMIISGSESLHLRKRIKETLGGRIFEFKVLPLSFDEYLGFIKKAHLTENLELNKEEIIKIYKHFIKTNGFPELAGILDDAIIYKYLKESVIDKILFKDIPRLFKVKNIDALAEILDIIIFSPGQIIDMTKLSKELGISRQAVSNYLSYLEKSFLVKKIYNFSRNLRKQKRSLKKYYPAVVFPAVTRDNFPDCFENSLIWQLDAQFFFRDAYKNEVDIILVGEDKKIMPVEIKTGKPDIKSTAYVTKKLGAGEAKILTLSYEKKYGNISIIPFYKYLLQHY